MNKPLLIVVLLVLLLGGGYAIWQSGLETQETSAPVVNTDEDTTVRGKNVRFVVTEGETKKWQIEAKEALYNDTQTEAELKGVKGEFYDAEGKPVMTFTAPTGNYTTKNHAVVLTGGVDAKSSKEDGGSVRAPKMTWQAKSKEVLAEGGVTMDFGKMGQSQARTARFALDFSFISLQGGVETEMQP